MHIAGNIKNTAVGDIVVFDEFDHKEVVIDGDTFVVAKEDTLICKLEINERH